MNIQNVCWKINADIYDCFPEDDSFIGLTVLSNGWATNVEFLGILVWGDEYNSPPNDSDEWTEASLEAFIREEVQKIVKGISQIKLLWEGK